MSDAWSMHSNFSSRPGTYISLRAGARPDICWDALQQCKRRCLLECLAQVSCSRHKKRCLLKRVV
eukprot:scaffold199024_cov14-Tisochrysis_lutea.AAC.2